MKTIVIAKLATVSLVIFAWDNIAVAASDIEKVQFRDNQVFIWQNGTIAQPTGEVALPFDIVVQTNGTFTVKAGKERQLEDGEILGRDGMLIKPDGSITPVMDHVSSDRGRIVVVKDGETTELRGVTELGDGTIVSSDGRITPRDGATRKLLDGELLQPEGGSLPARDTITMKNGRVTVQKDGAPVSLDPARSITMNDGTKVLGDGTIIRFNGERTAVSEGQIIVIEGVVVRKR